MCVRTRSFSVAATLRLDTIQECQTLDASELSWTISWLWKLEHRMCPLQLWAPARRLTVGRPYMSLVFKGLSIATVVEPLTRVNVLCDGKAALGDLHGKDLSVVG